MKHIQYISVPEPKKDCTLKPVLLTDQTMNERYQKTIQAMKEHSLDVLVIYADIEHGNNFEYLTGFLPRFEEALLVIHQDGRNYMVMGNENLNKVGISRIQATAIHCPYFSLPNQPMETKKSFQEILQDTMIESNSTVGLVGWKNFTSQKEDNSLLFDVPYYIVDALHKISHQVINATHIFIGNHGIRCINNGNELEHYEFGASLASDCMLDTLNQIEIGVSEMELANTLQAYGQKPSVVTIASTGKRFEKANLYPTNKQVQKQDPMSLTIGYKGGLSSRSGYAVYETEELPDSVQDYLDVLVKPYFHAICTWLEHIRCGMKGYEMYDLIESVLPKDIYHWSLNPGHLTSDEEWLSSCIYPNSQEVIQSGMMFQTDIIPSISGYAGSSVESTIALADANLRKELQENHPEFWDRIQSRRKYMEHTLGITLHPDVLPMCSTVAYLRPYLLNKEKAMMIKK